MKPLIIKPDPKFDLVLDREIDVPVDLVWKAWTTPEHVKHWFVPRPWTITSCEIDLRRGGAFSTVIRSPEGDEFPNRAIHLTQVMSIGWALSESPPTQELFRRNRAEIDGLLH